MATKNIGTSLVKTMSGDETEDLTVGTLTNIGEIGPESDEIDITTLDVTDGYRKFVAGLKDAGELSIEGIIDSESAMVAMLALADSQAEEEWTITTPNGSTWVFDGFVKMFREAEASVDEVRRFTGSIRISGKPVYTGGGASA